MLPIPARILIPNIVATPVVVSILRILLVSAKALIATGPEIGRRTVCSFSRTETPLIPSVVTPLFSQSDG
jgi:hypothetical protein